MDRENFITKGEVSEGIIIANSFYKRELRIILFGTLQEIKVFVKSCMEMCVCMLENEEWNVGTRDY